MPEIRGYEPGSTDSYGKMRVDPRSLAAARVVASEIGMPTDLRSLPSVFLRVVEVDPLLIGLDRTLHRLDILRGMSFNGGSEIVAIEMPISVRYEIERTAADQIAAWKALVRNPVKYCLAALIDIYGD